MDGPFDQDSATKGLRDRLVRASELPDFASLGAHLRHTQGEVRAVFERLLGKPGKEAAKKSSGAS